MRLDHRGADFKNASGIFPGLTGGFMSKERRRGVSRGGYGRVCKFSMSARSKTFARSALLTYHPCKEPRVGLLISPATPPREVPVRRLCGVRRSAANRCDRSGPLCPNSNRSLAHSRCAPLHWSIHTPLRGLWLVL